MPVVQGVLVAISPPDGYEVDFEHPRRNSQVAAYVLFGADNILCFLFMFQRVYVRFVVQRAFFIEDGFLFVAYVSSMVFQSLVVRDFAREIMGIHGWEMPSSQYARFLRALYVLPLLYHVVQCCAKMALLLVYRRISSNKRFRIMVCFTAFIVIGFSVAALLAGVLSCRPVDAAWEVNPASTKKCINRIALYKSTATFGALTDVMVLVLPMPMVIHLQLPSRQKLGLIMFFSIGFLTVFTSIMRLVTIIKDLDYDDRSWGYGKVLLWFLAEANLSCICASLPTLKPFLRHISPRFLGSSDPRSMPRPLHCSSQSILNSTVGGSAANREPEPGDQRFDDGPTYPLRAMTTHVYASSPGPDGRRSGSRQDSSDGGSSEGKGRGQDGVILKTFTTTVTYSERRDSCI